MLVVSEAFRKAFPGACAGALVMTGVSNPDFYPALDQQRENLEKQLRERYADLDRAALKQIPAIRAYNAYYTRFGQNYHVQFQLESVVLKGRSSARRSALLQAMFLAELKNLLLTAGHDLTAVRLPVTVTVATGTERYTLLNGQEQVLKAGDMIMCDQEGVISSVLYGPDSRTRIQAGTTGVVFAVYAPEGIGALAVRQHLQDLAAFVQVVAPTAHVQTSEV